MKIRLNRKTKEELGTNGVLSILKTEQKQIEENITTYIDEPFLKPENIRHGITIAGIDGKYADVKYLNVYSSDGTHLSTLASTEPQPEVINSEGKIILTNSPFESQCTSSTIPADCCIRKENEEAAPIANSGSVTLNTRIADIVVNADNPEAAFIDIPKCVESSLLYYAELPEGVLTEADYKIDLSFGSRMWVFKNGDMSTFSSIESELRAAGFHETSLEDTEESFGNSLCRTYRTFSQTCTLQYLSFKYKGSSTSVAADHTEVRLIEESRTGEFGTEAFSATGMVHAEIASNDQSYPGALIMVSDNAGSPSSLITPTGKRYPGLSGFIFQLNDGSFFILDSGFAGDQTNYDHYLHLTDTFMKALEAYAPDPNNIHVRGWLFTHMHIDHMGILLDIAKHDELASRFKIDKILYEEPPKYLKAVNNELDPYNIPAFREAVKKLNPGECVRTHVGERYFFQDLTVRIVGAPSTLLGATNPVDGSIILDDPHFNDTSVVSLITYKDKNLLFLGDAEQHMNRAVVNPLLPDDIDVYAVQVAHHGYPNSKSRTDAQVVYELINPTIAFWPVAYEHYSGEHLDGSTYYEQANKPFGANKDADVNVALKNIFPVYPVDNLSMVCTNFESETWEFTPIDFNSNSTSESYVVEIHFTESSYTSFGGMYVSKTLPAHETDGTQLEWNDTITIENANELYFWSAGGDQAYMTIRLGDDSGNIILSRGAGEAGFSNVANNRISITEHCYLTAYQSD